MSGTEHKLYQDEIAHRVCIILRRSGPRVQKKFCGRLLTVEEDMVILLFLWGGYKDVIDALVRVSSSEHKKQEKV